MKVGIIGAGFGGLAIAYKLAKKGIDVTVLEKESFPGGLAVGFKEKKWWWTLEKHYHHWFTSDWSVRNLAREIGHEVIFKRPKTSTLINGKIYQLDSAGSLLVFPELPIIDRVRTGLVALYLKITPFWKPLEKVTAEKFLKQVMGPRSWEVLWEPLFKGKFSKYSSKISAAWFWARVKKRSPSLGYPKGGFLAFAQHLEKAVKKNKGKVNYNVGVESIEKTKSGFKIKTDKDIFKFDKVICTLPTPLFTKLTKGLPNDYVKKTLGLEGVGAVNLVLSLKKSLLDDGTYWLNVNEQGFPFLAVVEHTNFVNKRNYSGSHLIYVGNYVPHEHEYFKLNEKEMLEKFVPYLKKINKNLTKSWIKKSYLFKAPFAQPIVTLNYSSKIPDFKTPIKGLYLCNIQQVYPWDRGTNYAVELGEKVAELVLKSK